MSQPEAPEGSPGPPLVRLSERLQRWAFVAAIGLSAFLLFSLELRAGRLVLPVFGGAPAVWTTGLCFFTAVLFLGYVYAHFAATRVCTGELLSAEPKEEGTTHALSATPIQLKILSNMPPNPLAHRSVA